MDFNIYTCNSCNRQVMAEERESHVCESLKSHKILGDTLWVFDGKKWYPLKLHQPSLNTKNDQPPTEQNL
jgi:hypothetical protein